MLVTINSADLRRPVTDGMFADITTVAVVRVEDTGTGTLTVEFASDLTPEQVTAVQRRLRTSNANEETMWQRADAALADLRLIRDSTGTLTGAQLSSAVRVLARVCIGLVRLRLRQLEGTD